MKFTSRKEGEVWKVCTILMSQNRSLTYQTIGDTLVDMGYKRGSNSDIYKYLQTWREHHGERIATTPLFTHLYPDTVPNTPHSNQTSSDPSNSKHLKSHLRELLSPLEIQLNGLKMSIDTLTAEIQSQSLQNPTSPSSPSTIPPTFKHPGVIPPRATMGDLMSPRGALESRLQENSAYTKKIQELARDLALAKEEVLCQTQRRIESERLRQLTHERLKEALRQKAK